MILSLTNPLCKQPILRCQRISSALNLVHIGGVYTCICAYGKRLEISPKHEED